LKIPLLQTGTFITIDVFGKKGSTENYLRLKKLAPVQQRQRYGMGELLPVQSKTTHILTEKIPSLF
jgi:hypothetical protein